MSLCWQLQRRVRSLEGGISHGNGFHQPVTFSCSFWSGDLSVPQTQMTQAPKLPPAGKESQTSHPGVTSALAAVKNKWVQQGRGVCVRSRNTVSASCASLPQAWAAGRRDLGLKPLGKFTRLLPHRAQRIVLGRPQEGTALSEQPGLGEPRRSSLSGDIPPEIQRTVMQTSTEQVPGAGPWRALQG